MRPGGEDLDFAVKCITSAEQAVVFFLSLPLLCVGDIRPGVSPSAEPTGGGTEMVCFPSFNDRNTLWNTASGCALIQYKQTSCNYLTLFDVSGAGCYMFSVQP